MIIDLKKGHYPEFYGEPYYVEFNYDSKEQADKMYEFIENILIPNYGARSTRALINNKEFILPYYADQNGQMVMYPTNRIGGTNIPEDILPELISTFIEEYGATVKIGDNQIKDYFDYEQFRNMISKFEFQVILKKGQYPELSGEPYYVEFNYGSKEQAEKMYEFIENIIIPHYGAHSTRALIDNKEFVLPYYADENGQMVMYHTDRIGGTNIPEDLLPDFIFSFVKNYRATVKIGDNQIKGQFDYGQFNDFLASVEHCKLK